MTSDLLSNSQSEPYVLILAGGSGERFWPLSRRNRPKQLLPLVSERTLLEETVERLESFTSAERLFILTNQDQESAIRELFPQLKEEQIIAEPAKRDTAAAIALGVGVIARRDPNATMVVLPADHVIQNTKAFQRDLLHAVHTANSTQALITIGIKPTWACSGFGYIELEQKLEDALYHVTRFREKPAPALAQSFFEQANYRWNAGMFVWTVAAIYNEFHQHAPEFAGFIKSLRATADVSKTIQTQFHILPKISIDYAIMEKASQVLCLEATFDWDDVGTWTAVAEYLNHDAHGNALNKEAALLESHGNIVYVDKHSKQHVALLGVNDLIIVQTEDALLVCHRSEAEKIKQLVASLPSALQ